LFEYTCTAPIIVWEYLKKKKGVIVKAEPLSDVFYAAEKYHQDYWAKWSLRIPLLIATLFVGGKFGGDMSQTIYNCICYGFTAAFTLLERKVGTSVDKIIVDAK
jgi:hypothetical protein